MTKFFFKFSIVKINFSVTSMLVLVDLVVVLRNLN